MGEPRLWEQAEKDPPHRTAAQIKGELHKAWSTVPNIVNIQQPMPIIMITEKQQNYSQNAHFEASWAPQGVPLNEVADYQVY